MISFVPVRTICVAALLATSLCAIPAFAQETVGSSLVSRTTDDTAIGLLMVDTSDPFTKPGNVTSWGFFSDDASRLGNALTPVILQQTGATYTVTGYGTTRINAATGVQTFSFDLASGSALVDTGYFMGWKDGSATSTSNTGVALYDDGGPEQEMSLGQFVNVVVGNSYSSIGTFQRTYSIQETATVSSTPEPGTFAFLISIGVTGAGCLARRRRTK